MLGLSLNIHPEQICKVDEMTGNVLNPKTSDFKFNPYYSLNIHNIGID